MKLPKLFAKKQSVDPDIAVIEQIHHEFESAGEELLQEATRIINASKVLNKSKIGRLQNVGFIQSREVIEATKIMHQKHISEQLAKTVEYYKVKYPLNKFITLDKIQEICMKYNLIYAEIVRYIGFVPEKNLKEIEDFSIKLEDTPLFISARSSIYNSQVPREMITDLIEEAQKQNVRNEDILNWLAKEKGIYADYHIQIAAPQIDFDIASNEEIKDFKIVKKVIPDPVVFAPVIDGFLIVTAWGKESEDPLVKNESEN